MLRRIAWWRLIVGLAGLVVALAVVFGAWAALTAVPIVGDSMKPTLRDGDRVLLASTSGTKIERFELVVAKWVEEGDNDVVKRVVGLPGDTIRVESPGHVLIKPRGAPGWSRVVNPAWDGQWKQTTSRCPLATAPLDLASEQTVPAGKLFVLGDNPDSSCDSRQNGWIDLAGAKQRIRMRVWPTDGFGTVGSNVRMQAA